MAGLQEKPLMPSRKVSNEYNPDYVSPPGETLLELIEDLGMSHRDLALRMNIDEGVVTRVIAGAASITPEIALALELVLGKPTATFWENRERLYRKQKKDRGE